ncbi:MAG: Na+/H+ antiporter NhaC family protein [bacterium]|nr:Na+/H+ antiporter NhaC family protein [bacterium]
MTRLISLLAFAALVAALFFVPEPAPGQLAAAQAGKALYETVEGPGEDRPVLWQSLLSTRSCSRRDDGTIELRLAGSLLRIDTTPVDDLIVHEKARQSVVRELRAIAADKTGWFREHFGIDAAEPVTFEIADQRAAGSGEVGLETVVRDGELELGYRFPGEEPVVARITGWFEPSWISILPPLVAIFLAILFRMPVLSLFSGVLLGSILVLHAAGIAAGAALRDGALNVRGYFWDQFIEPERYMIILFVVFMLAMVGVLTKSGGLRGVMDGISKLAGNAKRTQLATYLMGLAVFFDDYANTILVGSTMRPLSDKFKIAREKLAYIVDSTAAPVAGISIFSTWIAFEVSTFSAQLPDAGLAPSDGYAVFMQTLPYRFYCLFTLVFVGLLVITGRDFGPMLTAQKRAANGKILRDGAKPLVGKAATDLAHDPSVTPRARLALVPLITFVTVTLFEIVRVGSNGFAMSLSEVFTIEGMTAILYGGSGSRPLMLGALAGLIVASLMAFGAGLRGQIPSAAWATLRSMGIAIVILYLAWMIGAVCGDLGTASYLSVLLQEHLPAILLPVILFGLSGLVAFSTGSSWSTMTILLPLVVGLAYQLGEGHEIGGALLVVISIGAVLEGAIFGDHCSPISDTTVMSSIASASDHIDHVRTQMPYAITTMLVALVVGYFPAAFLGMNPFISLALGVAVLAGIVLIYGKRPEQANA